MMEKRRAIFIQYFILLALVLVAGYLVSLALWNAIALSFSNPYFASGKLARLGFNPINNQLRWAMFVVLPSILIFLVYLVPYFRKKIPSLFNYSNPLIDGNFPKKNTEPLNKYLYLTILFLVLIPCLVFVGKNFSTSNFDVFHEGEQITPALNYLTGNGGIWTRTLFVHGAVYDVYTVLLGWKLFGVTSIGAYRIALDLLKLLIPFSLAILLFAVWHALKNTRIAIPVVVLMFLFYVCTWRIQNLDRRDVPLLIGMSFLFFVFNNRNRILYFCAGLLSAVSFFYSADIGVYFTALLLVFPIILAIFKKHTFKDLLLVVSYLCGGMVTGFLFFYALVGHTEFMAFITNFLYFARTKELIDSYVYPFPNLLTSFRFTLPMLISAFNLLLYATMFISLYLKDPKLKNIAVIHSTLTFISLLHYRSALGRSDLTHIEVNSGLIILTLGFNVALLLALFLSNRVNNYLVKFSTLITMAVLLSLGFSQISLANIITFPHRLKVFVQEDSLKYVNKDRVEGIKELRQIFTEEKCVLSLTSEAALPYLLNKPSCGSLYISYFASAEPVRTQFLSAIKKYNPKYLLFSSKSWTQEMDRISNESRFPNVTSYVTSNYTFYKTVSDYWTVYIKN